MRNLNAILCLTLTVFLGRAGMSWRADLQKGLDAANRGDYATALRELKPLAEQGNAYAQNNLGSMCDKGIGVPQDNKTAVKWYKLAAKQGDAKAQDSLGRMYRKGLDVRKNYKTSVKWSRLAAEQGHTRAQGQVELLLK